MGLFYTIPQIFFSKILHCPANFLDVIRFRPLIRDFIPFSSYLASLERLFRLFAAILCRIMQNLCENPYFYRNNANKFAYLRIFLYLCTLKIVNNRASQGAKNACRRHLRELWLRKTK